MKGSRFGYKDKHVNGHHPNINIRASAQSTTVRKCACREINVMK